MKPAFTELKVKNNGKKLKVTGPIDLDGSEYEGYIWVRVTQSAVNNDPTKPRVDGTGTADSSETKLRDELVKAQERLVNKVEALDGQYGTGKPLAVEPRQVVQLVEASDRGLVAEGAVWAAMVVGP
jgi:hypothetical protein